MKAYCEKVWLLLLLLLITSCGAEQNLKKGQEHLALGEYFDAGTQFRQAYLKTPAKEKADRGRIAALMALSYDKANLTQKAIAAYRNMHRYQKMTVEQRFSLGRLLLKNGEYKEAERIFLALQEEQKDNSPLIANGLQSARMAPIWKKEGSRYRVKKMTFLRSE